MEVSDDLAALISRADAAIEQARVLTSEHHRWRRAVLQQLDYLSEIGAEFRRTPRID